MTESLSIPALHVRTRSFDAAQQSGVKLGVIFQDRMKPDIQRLKKWIDEDVLGKPILVDARVKWYRPPEYYGDSKWRGSLELDGGGALINQGVHTVDLLLWLLGDVVRVQARATTALHKIEAEDTVVATLEFANGALGTLQATTAAYPGYPRRVEITGSQGTVILEHDRIVAADLHIPQPQSSTSKGDENRSASSAAVTDIRGHQAVLEDFLRAIQVNSVPAWTAWEAGAVWLSWKPSTGLRRIPESSGCVKSRLRKVGLQFDIMSITISTLRWKSSYAFPSPFIPSFSMTASTIVWPQYFPGGSRCC